MDHTLVLASRMANQRPLNTRGCPLTTRMPRDLVMLLDVSSTVLVWDLATRYISSGIELLQVAERDDVEGAGIGCMEVDSVEWSVSVC